ncbi:MAG: glycoside hydrolase family 88 protein [Bacteroidota bacterium]
MLYKNRTIFSSGRNLLPVFLMVIFALTNTQCTSAKNLNPTAVKSDSIAEQLTWAERMAKSVMKRNEKVWHIENKDNRKWTYTHGLVSLSFIRLWEQTKQQQYFDYAEGYLDDLIDEDGVIYGYKMDDFNIDKINSGKILYPIYEHTQKEKYQMVIHSLRKQLQWQPRNTKGGFWHKRRYPWQMWLDGLYMAGPFYAQYAVEYEQTEAFDDIAKQFILVEKNTRDAATGLLYHGWDESRIQRWSDPETGLSEHFWGRAMGWYAMALVDVLDYFPKDHPHHQELIDIFQRLAKALAAFQDGETGLWYQVVNLPKQEGNYKEATVSSMLAYAFAKGARKGYLDQEYHQVAQKAFDGIVENLIEIKDDGEVYLNKCCAVAGLGGSPYRDGSYDYYVNETIRSNDPKGTGPFIMASIELEILK